MKQQNSQQAEDYYPSRNGQPSIFLERQDPVVYSTDKNNCPIEQEKIQQYQENGFIVLEDIFSQSDIEALQAESTFLRQNSKDKHSGEVILEPGSGEVRSIFKIHESSAVFKKLATDKRLASLAEYLLGDKVYIHQSRLNYKLGFRGKNFYWHSDFETWHVEDGMPRMRALSMSITLTENYSFNGPLMLIPGSHRSFVVCEGETPEEHFKSSLKNQEYGVPTDQSLTQLVEEGGIVTATSKPGSVIIFDCNVMHGSNSNITPFPRSNIFLVYNSMANQVVAPFCERSPRPEFICTREKIEPVIPVVSNFNNE